MVRRGFVVFVGAVVMAGVLSWADEARAELPPSSGSVWGGAVDVEGRGALSVGAGWPSVLVRWDFATSGNFGIGIRSDLYYSFPLGAFFGFGGFAAGFDVPMRIQVLDRNDWSLSVSLDPGVIFGFDDYWTHHWDRDWGGSTMFGPYFDFGLIASVQPERYINIFFGLNMGIDIFVFAWDYRGSTVDVWIPMRPFVGFELQVARSIAIWAMLYAGPAISSHGWCGDWDDRYDGWECTRPYRTTGVNFTGKFQFGATFFF